MSSVKKEDLIDEINESPSFAILTDESSDINNRKHLAVAVKYMKEGASKICFVDDKQIGDGKAETIFSQITPIVEECGGFEKMASFTSDRGSAMVGKHEGVATKIKQRNKKIITMQCLNHKLTLATKDSFNS